MPNKIIIGPGNADIVRRFFWNGKGIPISQVGKFLREFQWSWK